MTAELSKRLAESITLLGQPTKLDTLNAMKPILLMPLRLETRFRGNSLWIRAFPDAIHIDQHQPLLTETEQRDGARYKKRAEQDPAQAWAELIAGRTPERAAWIARASDAVLGIADSPRAEAPWRNP